MSNRESSNESKRSRESRSEVRTVKRELATKEAAFERLNNEFSKLMQDSRSEREKFESEYEMAKRQTDNIQSELQSTMISEREQHKVNINKLRSELEAQSDQRATNVQVSFEQAIRLERERYQSQFQNQQMQLQKQQEQHHAELQKQREQQKERNIQYERARREFIDKERNRDELAADQQKLFHADREALKVSMQNVVSSEREQNEVKLAEQQKLFEQELARKIEVFTKLQQKEFEDKILLMNQEHEQQLKLRDQMLALRLEREKSESRGKQSSDTSWERVPTGGLLEEGIRLSLIHI